MQKHALRVWAGVILVGIASLSLAPSAQADSYVSGGVSVGGPGWGISVGGGNGGYMGGMYGGGGFFGGMPGFGGTPWLSNPFGLPQGSILGIVASLTYWLLALLGFIGIIGFVIAGMRYLLAFGDEDDAKRAKNGLKFSIYGIIVALLGFIIIRAVTALLSGVSGGF